MLSGEDVFINNIHDTDRRGDALVAHAKFENEFGDHLTLLNIFKAYAKAERPKTWCHDNFLNIRNLGYALEVRNQLSEICQRVSLEFESCGNQFDQVNFIIKHFIDTIFSPNIFFFKSFLRLFSSFTILGTKMSFIWSVL